MKQEHRWQTNEKIRRRSWAMPFKDNLQTLFISQSSRKGSLPKLPAVLVSADLRWDIHIDYSANIAAVQLYFLKQLRRAGLPPAHLLHFHITVISTRPRICFTFVAPNAYQSSDGQKRGYPVLGS